MSEPKGSADRVQKGSQKRGVGGIMGPGLNFFLSQKQLEYIRPCGNQHLLIFQVSYFSACFYGTRGALPHIIRQEMFNRNVIVPFIFIRLQICLSVFISACAAHCWLFLSLCSCTLTLYCTTVKMHSLWVTIATVQLTHLHILISSRIYAFFVE